jgi:hypothetical protein
VYSFIKLILLYPYPYKTFAFFIVALVFIVIALFVYGTYKLIIQKMTERTSFIFKRILTSAWIYLLALFFTEITVTLITQHQVNKQLGFNYGTPETTEGEPFLITRVVPGKTMDKAGLRKEDIVQMWNTCHLYRLLINNQGKEVTFSILRDEKDIIIRVKVPEMDLPPRWVSFLF